MMCFLPAMAPHLTAVVTWLSWAKKTYHKCLGGRRHKGSSSQRSLPLNIVFWSLFPSVVRKFIPKDRKVVENNDWCAVHTTHSQVLLHCLEICFLVYEDSQWLISIILITGMMTTLKTLPGEVQPVTFLGVPVMKSYWQVSCNPAVYNHLYHAQPLSLCIKFHLFFYLLCFCYQ